VYKFVPLCSSNGSQNKTQPLQLTRIFSGLQISFEINSVNHLDMKTSKILHGFNDCIDMCLRWGDV